MKYSLSYKRNPQPVSGNKTIKQAKARGFVIIDRHAVLHLGIDEITGKSHHRVKGKSDPEKIQHGADLGNIARKNIHAAGRAVHPEKKTVTKPTDQPRNNDRIDGVHAAGIIFESLQIYILKEQVKLVKVLIMVII